MGTPKPGTFIGTRLYTEPGYLILEEDGRKSQLAIEKILRAADIPTGLTYAQVGAISTIANLLAMLVRTLISREVIGEEFLEEGEIDLLAFTEAIEQMGGDYGDPDISVS